MPRLLLLAQGNSVHTARWACAMRDRGYDVEVASLVPGAIPGIPVHVLAPRLVGKLGYLTVLRQLRALLRRFRPDLVHAHYGTSYGLLAAWSGHHPRVLSLWGSDILDFPRRSPLHAALLRYTLRQADAVTATSRVMAEAAEAYAPGRKAEVIPFGVDTETFSVAPLPETLTIGCAKALEPLYGQEYLIRALRLLVDRKPQRPLRLVLAGEGSARGALERLTADLGLQERVVFRGHLDHAAIPDFMRGLTIFAMPSLQESFGVAALEAAASGRPVVATRVGGVPEVVEDGVTGLLVPPADERALAEALERLLEDRPLGAAMGAAGRERVMEHYDWPRNVARMEALYQRLLASRTEQHADEGGYERAR